MTGILFIISAPSGTGKTSLINALVEKIDNIAVSVSHTTRPKRSKEEHGKHYYFVDEATFMTMRQQDEFLEYANVYGYYYGTSKHLVEWELNKNNDVILAIDWQGANKVKAKLPEAVSIFILPPSIDILRERLILRAQDTPDVINKRMAEVEDNISRSKEYDYIIINDDFEQAVITLVSIIHNIRDK